MTRQEKIDVLNNLINDLERLGNKLDKSKKELEGKTKDSDDSFGDTFNAYKEFDEKMKKIGQDVKFKSVDDFIKEDPSLAKKITYEEFMGNDNYTKKMTKI